MADGAPARPCSCSAIDERRPDPLQALTDVLAEGTRTRIGGTATTSEFRDAIARRLSNG